jgi:hypothetical protein
MISLSSRKSHCGLAWQGRTITEQLPSAAKSYTEGVEGLALGLNRAWAGDEHALVGTREAHADQPENHQKQRKQGEN